ncbi:hypothetical protein HU200_063957 [Digitaria exilis]|uniref:Uncharacterized protein n=1 Tax=Digitaria exilis TaxID=1010633 RepID=A0A835DYR4_9POAL|nr:hypothetical protein HU200_063957 [Digitaria exilis]
MLQGCCQAHIETTASSRTTLGCLMFVAWLLAADHGGWCCLATISVMWDNVVMMALAAMTTWDELACSVLRRGAQHGWVLLVRYSVGRWRK